MLYMKKEQNNRDFKLLDFFQYRKDPFRYCWNIESVLKKLEYV